jgi:hypothetical protein
MAAPRRPDPPPLRTNEYLPPIVGTALWCVAAIVLAVKHSEMAARGQGWWLWVAVAGIVIGLWGLTMVTLRQRGLREAAKRTES